MSTYSWPANLAKNEAGWITSLVDWPEIAAIDNSAQASVLTASQNLSAAIQDRLSKGLKIPLQSELKPGQVEIVVNTDTSAQLDSYLENMQEKQLKRQSEIEQINREKRAAYLTEYRINLDSVERLRDHADQGAIEFASIGVKSIYVLNGGALVAIPAILKFTQGGTISKGYVVAAVIFFVAGILLAAAANYLAYRSMFQAGAGHAKEMNARAVEVSNNHYPPEDPSISQAKIKESRSEHDDLLLRANRLADKGVVVFGTSFLAFLAGSGIIIYGLGGEYFQ